MKRVWIVAAVAAMMVVASTPAENVSITDWSEGALTPVLEYDVTNYAGGAIPNTGVKTNPLTGAPLVGAQYGSQVTGGKDVTAGPAGVSRVGGAPEFVTPGNGRSYLSFQDYGYATTLSPGWAQLADNTFNIATGYTLVGYYRFTPEFYSPANYAAIGSQGTGNANINDRHQFITMYNVPAGGKRLFSWTMLAYNNPTHTETYPNPAPGGSDPIARRLTDELTDLLPGGENYNGGDTDGWFQFVKVFKPAVANPATGEKEWYEVAYYINGEYAFSSWYKYLEGDVFSWLNGGLGDIGMNGYSAANPGDNMQVKGLDYGYFAAYNMALNAEQVAMTYEYLVPVPEPATMTLLALGGLALLRRRRR